MSDRKKDKKYPLISFKYVESKEPENKKPNSEKKSSHLWLPEIENIGEGEIGGR